MEENPESGEERLARDTRRIESMVYRITSRLASRVLDVPALRVRVEALATGEIRMTGAIEDEHAIGYGASFGIFGEQRPEAESRYHVGRVTVRAPAADGDPILVAAHAGMVSRLALAIPDFVTAIRRLYEIAQPSDRHARIVARILEDLELGTH